MSTLYFSLPTPAGAGAGPWIDVSKLGGDKTLKFSSVDDAPFGGSVVVDACLGDDEKAFLSIHQFDKPGRGVTKVAARLMRVRFPKHTHGAARVEVAGDSSGSRFIELPAPDNNGTGEIVDVGGFGTSMSTLVTAGKWSGVVNIQVSDDGDHFSDVVTLTTGGVRTFELQGRYMRVRRSGVKPATRQYMPRVDVGASNDAVDAGALEVTREGKFVGARSIINLVGAGIEAMDDAEHNRVNIQVAGGLSRTAGTIFVWGAELIGSDTTRRYLPLGPVRGMADRESCWAFTIPRNGTFRSLSARHNNNPKAKATYTLHINGEPTELSAVVRGSVGVDNANAVAVKAGDRVELVVTKHQPLEDSRVFSVVAVEFA